MYCYEKNVLNTSQTFTLRLYNISIKAVAKKAMHAPITPQSTKRVKNLKLILIVWPYYRSLFIIPPHKLCQLIYHNNYLVQAYHSLLCYTVLISLGDRLEYLELTSIHTGQELEFHIVRGAGNFIVLVQWWVAIIIWILKCKFYYIMVLCLSIVCSYVCQDWFWRIYTLCYI